MDANRLQRGSGVDDGRVGHERLVKTLADFRYQLRKFLAYSEHAAAHAGLHPQQHQLLLQVAATGDDALTTIAWAAERLILQHHSVVELVDRSVAEGLLRRTHDAQDRRRVILSITPKGRRTLDALSKAHVQELRELGPQLVRSLRHIESIEPLRARGGKRGADREMGARKIVTQKTITGKTEFPSPQRLKGAKQQQGQMNVSAKTSRRKKS